MNAAKKAFSRTKKFVTDHKVAITAVATATVTAAVVVKLQSRYLGNVQDYLTEKGLYEEFHNRFNDLES